jgi:hypothetical protein
VQDEIKLSDLEILDEVGCVVSLLKISLRWINKKGKEKILS